MRDSQGAGDRGSRPQTRPFGSSGLAALLAVVVFVLALIIAGVLVLGGGDDGDDFAVAGNTPTSETSGVISDPTSTPSADAVETVVSPTAETASPTPRVFPTLTPAPTSTPDPDADVPDPTATTASEEDVDGTEETPAAEPTTPEEIPPTPEEEPLAGDFGFLPPPQLPSGGAGQSLSLEYQLGASLESVPTTATVYEIEWPTYTEDEAVTMAANLGIDGEVVPQGEGVFSIEDAESSLFVSPTVIEYSAVASESGSGVPSDDVAIEAAWAWFSAAGISGITAGSADVVATEEGSGLSVVALWPENPSPNLAPTPSATIKVSGDGAVEEARVVWPADLIGSDYGLRSALAMWEDVRNGNSFVSADLSDAGSGSGTVTITDISVAYTVSGSPYDAQYIVPLMVFGGTAEINGVSVYVSAYVPAVYHQGNPLG